jgi:ATP dependent DNA ligase domain
MLSRVLSRPGAKGVLRVGVKAFAHGYRRLAFPQGPELRPARTTSWISLISVPVPQPMLSVSARRWPDGGRWMLQPKWDGFRLLVDVGVGGEVRGWSRHGADPTTRLGSLLAPFTDVAPGTTFDGELVVVTERDGKPAQDFAAVTRAVFTGQPAATGQLRFVAFDLLAVAGEDVRPHPWEDRDERLRETLPVSERIRLAASQPASLAAHEAIVALGFEGTVLKRVGSAYRPGRHRAWIKHKARFTASAVCVRCARIATVAGTPCANWMAGVFTPSRAPAPSRGSGSLSSWSTLASTPMAACARHAWRPSVTDGGELGRTSRRALRTAGHG